MKKIRNLVWLIVGVLVVAEVASQLIRNRLDQPRQRELHEWQVKVLNSSVAHVQLQNGKVLFELDPHSNMGSESDRNPSRNLMLLPVGSQFKTISDHWSGTYTIESIDADGVRIYFEAGGFAVGSLRGTTKILWK